jgi:hypothetical protein
VAGITLLAASGLGNLIDRFAQDGRVTDFINVGVGSVRTGIFNVADVLGVLGIVVPMLKDQGEMATQHRIFATTFSRVYPLHVRKVEKNGRTRGEVDEVICWLTRYSQSELAQQIKRDVDFKAFFYPSPAFHPNSSLIKGVVCGIRVEAVEDPLMRKIRDPDKLIDELAKGKSMDKILRQ